MILERQPVNMNPANEAAMKYDGVISSLSIILSSLSVKNSRVVSTVAETKVKVRIHAPFVYL